MRDAMIKKGGLFFTVFLILILISGCETIGAIGMGDIKMQDIAQMINPQTSDIGETGDIEKKNTAWEKIQEADTWMQQNLW